MRPLRFLVRVALSPHEAGKLRHEVAQLLRDLDSYKWTNHSLRMDNNALRWEVDRLRSEP